ncbi:MAG: YmdB family metallophosphoesterase, partial [Spirochaetales bacterium]|jgi:hypothetical protein|nr:YmdB family metallophosphoesterase [Spirochaetales bacterium]
MSVGGFEPEAEIEKQITQLPVRSKEYWEDTALVGVIVEIDETGKATAIEPIRSALKEE